MVDLLRGVAPDQLEKVVERSILELECAVHVGFAEVKLGIDGESPMKGAVEQADRDPLSIAIAEFVRAAIRIDQRERAYAHDAFHDRREDRHTKPRA